MYIPPAPEPKTASRPRDAERTRGAILQAARTLFSTRGYTNTGVREVADLAGVNSSLVGRYFGSKEGLFRATLEHVIDITPILTEELRPRLGQEMMEVLVHHEGASGPLAMMILSAADPAAHAVSVRFLQEKVLTPLAEWLGPPDGDERAARLNILWAGFLTASRLLPVRALTDERLASTRRWLEAETQAIVDGRPV